MKPNEPATHTRLRFGAVTPPLHEQLRGVLPAALAKPFQVSADAITHLHVRGFIPDGAARVARERLIGRIQRTIDTEQKIKEKKKGKKK